MQIMSEVAICGLMFPSRRRSRYSSPAARCSIISVGENADRKFLVKKILLLSVLVLFGGHKLMVQGSVLFQNTTVSTPFYTNTQGGGLGKVTTTPGTVAYALFYSDATTGGASNNLTFATAVGNSTTAY